MKSKPLLGADDARHMLDAAVKTAHENGLAMSIAIVDDGGFMLALHRLDGAGLLTPKVAVEKARTAALMRAPSEKLADRVASEPALLRLTDYLPMAGGIPALVGGHCAGAIGVSGGNPEQDVMVASAGIAALSEI